MYDTDREVIGWAFAAQKCRICGNFEPAVVCPATKPERYNWECSICHNMSSEIVYMYSDEDECLITEEEAEDE